MRICKYCQSTSKAHAKVLENLVVCHATASELCLPSEQVVYPWQPKFHCNCAIIVKQAADEQSGTEFASCSLQVSGS